MTRYRILSLTPIARSCRRRSGFTLIELLIVIGIIIILAGITVAVGLSAKSNAGIRSTKSTLKSLDGLMKEYLAAGNPEPAPSGTWPASFPANSPFAQTNPASDPVNWVKAFRSSPQLASKISSLKYGKAPTGDSTVLDSFGNPIRYVPSQPAPSNTNNSAKDGYFISAGVDGLWSTETPAPVQARPADEIFSTDPQ